MIPSSTQIVDSSLNVWTLSGGVVYENGQAAGFSWNVVLLLYDAGTVYQENKDCLWWHWNGSTWLSNSNPDPTITPSCSVGTASTPTATAPTTTTTTTTATATATTGTATTTTPATTTPTTGTTTTTPTATTTTSTPTTGTATGSVGGAARWAVDMVMEEALVPFSSWANVKTVYGAAGDGVTDDTGALQRALNDLGQAGKAQVLYLPAGTYRITATLQLTGLQTSNSSASGWGGVGIIGADPATTTIKWAGPAGQAMLIQNGGLGYRYNRITWDGSGSAGYGVAHWWDANGGTYYGGSFEHQDEVFENMSIGIMAGRLGANYGNMDSEGQVRRVTFINNSYAGLDTGSFNALDWWIWDSHFVNCARGVTNEYSLSDTGVTNGAGAMYVYRSLFEGSTVADFAIGNTGWFSLHNNVSIGSSQFINTQNNGENTAVVIVENNRVVGSTSSAPISYGDAGPLLLVDNQIQGNGAAYTLTDYVSDIDALSLGNQITAALPAGGAGKRVLSVSDTSVSTSSISSQAMALPATPALSSHQVFEVPAGASAAQIQSLINQAVTSGDVQPIIHFAAGNWSLNGGLSIPQDASIQFVGDGYGSLLTWNAGSGGSMLTIAAPARVTVRDMQWIGNASAISVTGADSPGGRIQMVAVDSGPVSATHLEQTQLSLQANPGIWTLSLDDVINAVAMGNGVVGTVSMSNNSSFLMADTWYEGDLSTLFTIPNGTFTYLGGHPAPANHTSVGNYAPMGVLNDFAGTASFIGMQMDLAQVTSGIGIQVASQSAQTNVYLMGNTSGSNGGTENNWFSLAGGGGDVGFNLNRETSGQYPNQGDSSNAAIISTWKQARSLHWDTAPYQVPAASTDIRIYHVKMDQTAGLLINGQ
jgi:hypothetical protein